MVSSVNTNINSMAAIQALTDIGNQMTTTQSAIESGYKVGAASDNPAVFTIAQGLRANVKALSAVSDDLSTGIATVQAQTQGATSISNALNTLLKTVTQGQGETGDALAATNATITNALANIDAFATATTINGVNLLANAGSLTVLSNVDGSTTNVTTSAASTTAGLGLQDLQVTTGATVITAGTAPMHAGDSVTYMDIGSGDETVFEFVDGTAATTTVPLSYVKVVPVMLSGADPTNSNTGQDVGALLNAMQTAGIAATEDSSGAITVNGGLVSVSNSTAATDLTATVTSVASGASAIAAVNAAIAQIGRTLSTLGAATIQLQGLSDFTGKLSDSVSTSLGAIVDANLSSESAMLASLQTKQSLAIQSLSLANQGPSSLLSLFR